MSVIQGVLFEEVQRLEKSINLHKEILKSLPSGSLFIRKIGNSSFAYLKEKVKGHVISKYLGNIEDIKVQEQIEKNKKYKRIKADLRVAGLELNKLKKAYKVYERQ